MQSKALSKSPSSNRSLILGKKSHLMLAWSFLHIILTLVLVVEDQLSIDVFFYWSCFYFFFVLLSVRTNVIYFLRILILVAVGSLPYLVKLISSDGLFGFHLSNSQTKPIASLLFKLSSLAVASSYIGLAIGKGLVFTKTKFNSEGRLFFSVSTFFLFLVAVLLDLSYGSSLLTGPGYAQGSEGLNTGLNNLNVIANALVLFCLIVFYNHKYDIRNRVVFKCFLFVTVYLVGFVYIGHGVRMDALNCLLGALLIHRIKSGKHVAVSAKLLISFLIIFVLMQIVGAVRSLGVEFDWSELPFYLERIFKSLIKSPSHGIYLYQGTVNDISTTFSGIVYLLQTNQTEYLYGSGYFDYILRTPPSFLYQDRPEDLAWVFKNLGYSSGGGFFELAEAFYNFGVFGVVVIPFLISLIVAASMRTFQRSSIAVFTAIPLISILSTFLRGSLYQTFAFYKAFITVVFLYFLMFFIVKVISKVGSN